MNNSTNPIATAGVHPGLNLKAELATRGIKQNELAAEIGILPSQLNEVLKGKRPITPDFALLIGAALNVKPERWIQLQASYNLNLARIETSNQEKVKAINEWQEVKQYIPISYFRKQGELTGVLATDTKRLLTILNFASVDELQKCMSFDDTLSIHFKKSPKLLEHKLAVQTWIRYVKYLSEQVKTSQFDFSCQPVILEKIKKVFLEKNVVDELTKVLNSYGIVLIIKDKPEKAPIDGAAFWHNGRPVIALTLRHKRYDNFLFTVYHELGHIFLHIKDNMSDSFVDSLDDVKGRIEKQEDEANSFAKNTLVPESHWMNFVNSHLEFSDDEMKRFATTERVPVVSVWGRLCFENRISYACTSVHRHNNDIP